MESAGGKAGPVSCAFDPKDEEMLKARAVQFVGPRRVTLCSVDLGDPSEGDVLVRTLYSGISSGTEMLAYRGQIDEEVALDATLDSLPGTFSYPFRYGYSCVGRVDRPSGELQQGSLVFAFHPHQDLFLGDPSALIQLPDIDPRLATLFPLVETALQVTLDAGTLQDEDAVVFGLGAVGLLTSVLLQRAGSIVTCVEPRGWRREVAGSLGLDAVSPDAAKAAVDRATEGRGARLVIDVTGNPEALGLGLELLGHEGVALVASWFGSQKVALPLGAEFHRRRLTIKSTQVSTIPAHLSEAWSVERRREVARSLLQELPLAAIATHDYPFSEAPAAYAAIDRGEEGLVHAALRYD
jgi:2-desacetyl-2-hydroxyethyl bacteriochlorophyllide A dehydrogenase